METPAKKQNPNVMQTPRWTKLTEAMELIKNIKNATMPMETFEDEPSPIYVDSPIRYPATPRNNMASTPMQRSRHLNLEEPTYPESFFDEKENVSSHNNSTLQKTSTTHKIFQLSRLVS